MSIEDAKLFVAGTLTKWQMCLLLSSFWPGSRVSPAVLYLAPVQTYTFVDAFYWLIAHDANEQTLWGLFSDSEVTAMQAYEEETRELFETWDLWLPVDEYASNHRAKQSISRFLRLRAMESSRRENGGKSVNHILAIPSTCHRTASSRRARGQLHCGQRAARLQCVPVREVLVPPRASQANGRAVAKGNALL